MNTFNNYNNNGMSVYDYFKNTNLIEFNNDEIVIEFDGKDYNNLSDLTTDLQNKMEYLEIDEDYIDEFEMKNIYSLQNLQELILKLNEKYDANFKFEYTVLYSLNEQAEELFKEFKTLMENYQNVELFGSSFGQKEDGTYDVPEFSKQLNLNNVKEIIKKYSHLDVYLNKYTEYTLENCY